VKVLITGGAGYIGSTVATALEASGHVPVVLDNLHKGRREFTVGRIFYENDIADRAALTRIVDEHPDIACTIHCAARIVVPESVEHPYEYYRDNVAKSLELFDALAGLDKPRVVFSSSASLYATSDSFEVTEESPLDPQSPYARTKLVMEMVLRDMCAATSLRAIILRYFNPIGADPDFRSGIYDKLPSHVLGRLVAAARGEIDAFEITGTEHPTRDGTGIRDYIHVADLAEAHAAAVRRLAGAPETALTVNAGRGVGVSVREIIRTVGEVVGQPELTGAVEARRPGDVARCVAAADRIRTELGWTARLGVREMVESAWAGWRR
jgi:UDP-glucose 4-epimerase